MPRPDILREKLPRRSFLRVAGLTTVASALGLRPEGSKIAEAQSGNETERYQGETFLTPGGEITEITISKSKVEVKEIDRTGFVDVEGQQLDDEGIKEALDDPYTAMQTETRHIYVWVSEDNVLHLYTCANGIGSRSSHSLREQLDSELNLGLGERWMIIFDRDTLDYRLDPTSEVDEGRQEVMISIEEIPTSKLP